MGKIFRLYTLLLLLLLGVMPFSAQETGNTHRVIVPLDIADQMRSFSGDDVQHIRMIQSAGDSFLRQVSASEIVKVTRFQYIPYIALELTDAGYQQLLSLRSTSQIFADTYSAPMLNGAVTQIGADGVGGAWQMGYTGIGQVVAVLDSGIDYFHPALQGKIIAEACFSSNGTLVDRNGNTSTVTPVCPNGQQTAIGLYSALNCSSEITNCDHGTLTTGAIVSQSNAYRGVAPQARIFAVQVFSRVDGGVCPVDWGYASPCILSFVSDQIRGLEYVYSQRNRYNFAAVSLSLGAGFWSSPAQCDADNAPRKAIVDLLASADIPVISPTGNSGYSDRMLAPACISSVIAVSSVDDNDMISTFSDTTTFMDLFAPGNNIRSTTIGGQFADKSGTSMATPIVAGAFAVMRDANSDMTSRQIFDALKRHGVPIAHNGKTSPRIDLKSALIATAVRQTSPINNLIVSDYPLKFSWYPIPEADVLRYKLILYNKKTGEIIRQEVQPAECDTLCTVSLNRTLPEGTVHQWKVKAILPTGKRVSNKWNFLVDYPENITLLTPDANAVLGSPQELTAFSWQALTHGIKYKVVLQNAATKERLMASKTTCTPLSFCAINVPVEVQNRLVDGQQYFWKLKILLNDGRWVKAKRFFTANFTPQLFRQSQ